MGALGLGVCGPSGRFKKALVKKVVEHGGRWDDESVAPVLRQTRTFILSQGLQTINFILSVQHWGYKLTEADYRAYL